ncbi:a813fa8e-9d2d-4fa6-a942-d5b23cc450cd [Sclerotinia trifoliorum]|uniref:A813fa8e-9d2d-4fa6-a942-d5b23cc450cd n=1 Tax=Sclerotinia trifoliorum TaxID=28548 RepID=A0A8H2VSI8_9HELO|nr:a813fa8e-9d2d-4fa6-a942-d5b23cc450cd [Sclerotinia trifoliorum]
MGQRHQLFIIAKINGRYRGLAAVHHQWLYGDDALKICLNIRQILQSPANRIALSHELRHATHLSKKDWKRYVNYSNTSMDDVPFPFILTCLVIGSALDVKDNYYHAVDDLPFNLPFNGGDNNDGITIFDITELEKVRYCFVNFSDYFYDDEVDAEQAIPPPPMTPLTGPQYLWGYRNKDDPAEQEKFKDLIESFETVPLVDCRALYSAWPDPEWMTPLLRGEKIEWVLVEEILEEEEHSTNEESNVGTADFPSLRASSLARVLNVIIEGTPSELPQIIESASLLPDFYPTAKSKLYADPTIVSNFASARRLLSTILKSESIIDLGPFDLTTEQIFEVLNERLNNPTDVIGLSFSGNANITEEFLGEILVKFPRLEFLYLLNTPQIPLNKKIELLRGTTVQFYDTELLALPFVNLNKQCVDTLNESEAPAHGHIKPVVSQLIMFTCSDASKVQRDNDGGICIESCFPNGVIRSSFMSPDHTCIPFGEMDVPPSAFIAGITQYIHYLMSKEPFIRIDMADALQIAKYLAIPNASSEDNENSLRVGAIPGHFQRQKKDKYSKIMPGEWTLAIIGEIYCDPPPAKNMHTKVRYAFVTVAPPINTEDSTSDSYVPEFIIEDFRGFLDSTIPDPGSRQHILEGWNKAVASDNSHLTLELSGRQEVESLMRALVYPVSEATESRHSENASNPTTD